MLDTITTYLLTLLPSLSSIIGIITAISVAIKKMKQANKDTENTIKAISAKNDELLIALRGVVQENAELKQQQKQLMAKIQHIHFVDKEK